MFLSSCIVPEPAGKGALSFALIYSIYAEESLSAFLHNFSSLQ